MIETFTACSFCLRMPIDRNLGSDSILKAKGAEQEEKDYLSFLKVQQIAVYLISAQADVYFLQGLKEHGEDFIKPFLDRNFTVIRLNSKTFETAIAINPERFAFIANISVDILMSSGMTDAAIACVKDKKNNHFFCFSSLTIPIKDVEMTRKRVQIKYNGKKDHFMTTSKEIYSSNTDTAFYTRNNTNSFGNTFFSEYVITRIMLNSEDPYSSCLKKFSSECQPTFTRIETEEIPSRLSGLFQGVFTSEPKTKEE